VYEAGLGMPIRELVESAGGTAEPVSAYLIGGYFGSWVAAADAERAALLDSQLRPLGASLGARTLFLLPACVCGIVETARLARYLATESAGQCGPCVHGLDAIAGGLERLARPERADLPRLERWLEQVRGRGACRHPDGASPARSKRARRVRSARSSSMRWGGAVATVESSCRLDRRK